MSEAIRVLEVFHGMDCGGAESMIMNLYRKIDRSKVQFDFLVHTDKKCFFDEEIKELGGRVYSVPYYNVVNTIQYNKAVENFFLNHPEYHIVHGHLGSCSHIYLKIAKKHGCFTIAHGHNTKPEFSVKNVLYRYYTFKTRKIADYFMGCSKAALLYRYGNDIANNSQKSCVFNNAIDTDLYIFNEKNREKYRNELKIQDTFVIGHIGRFSHAKNHRYLLEIFSLFHKKYKNSKLLLIGDGALRTKLENKIRELHLSSAVIMTGVRDDVPKLLSAMDVFLLPSLYEGLGIVAVEAQAAGVHAICADSLPEESKLTPYIEYASINEKPEYWASLIEKYIDGYPHLNFKRNIVEAGYDINQTVKILEEFYINKY